MRKSALFAFGIVTAVLVVLGMVVLSSASLKNGQRLYGDPYYFMRRQFLYLGAGIVVMVGVALFDYRHWRDNWLLTSSFALGVFVLLWGVFLFPKVNGSWRWIALGPVRLQPSELAKLAIVILIAAWMDRAGWRVELFRRGTLLPILMIGAMALPISQEIDYGATMVVGLAGALVMFVAGARMLHLLPFILLGLGGGGWLVAHNANRMARIAAFLGMTPTFGVAVQDAAADRAKYQVEQSLIAIKNAKLWGNGLLNSMQKQYYLPEAHTDFIFAVGAEELGIEFSVSVLLLFVAFFGLAVYIAYRAQDRFGRLLVVGMGFIIFFQAMFNIGVVCKALPTKGMALPFFSYGGTNLLAACFAVGTILSVGIHSYRERRCGIPSTTKA